MLFAGFFPNMAQSRTKIGNSVAIFNEKMAGKHLTCFFWWQTRKHKKCSLQKLFKCLIHVSRLNIVETDIIFPPETGRKQSKCFSNFSNRNILHIYVGNSRETCSRFMFPLWTRITASSVTDLLLISAVSSFHLF